MRVAFVTLFTDVNTVMRSPPYWLWVVGHVKPTQWIALLVGTGFLLTGCGLFATPESVDLTLRNGTTASDTVCTTGLQGKVTSNGNFLAETPIIKPGGDVGRTSGAIAITGDKFQNGVPYKVEAFCYVAGSSTPGYSVREFLPRLGQTTRGVILIYEPQPTRPPYGVTDPAPMIFSLTDPRPAPPGLLP